jgi:multiple sugar transport system permease protein
VRGPGVFQEPRRQHSPDLRAPFVSATTGVWRTAVRAYHHLRFRSFGYVLIAPAVAVLLAVVIYPMFFSLWISLHQWVLSRPTSFPFVGLQNYMDLVTRDDVFPVSIRVTTLLVVFAVGAEFLIGLGLALLLNRRDIRGRRLILSLLTMPLVVTPVVAGVLWKFMLHPRLGIVNYLLGLLGLGHPLWAANPRLALLSVALVDIWQWTPFMLIVLYAGLVALPVEPVEAAQLDGASGWNLFRHVTMPMISRVAIVALLIRTIDTFKMFDVVYVLTRGGPGNATEVVSLYTYRVGLNYFDMGRAAAISWVISILLVALGQVYLKAARFE